MPRKRSEWVETVEEFPSLQPGVWYVMLVVGVARCASPRGIRVVLEHLGAEQSGRRHELILSLPIRAGNGFFAACGLSVVAGQAIRPEEVVGRQVQARFAPGVPNSTPEVVAFAPVRGGGATDQQASASGDVS